MADSETSDFSTTKYGTPAKGARSECAFGTLAPPMEPVPESGTRAQPDHVVLSVSCVVAALRTFPAPRQHGKHCSLLLWRSLGKDLVVWETQEYVTRSSALIYRLW